MRNFFLIIFILFGKICFGQNVKIETEISHDSILIGDHFKLKLLVSYPIEGNILFPEFDKEVIPGIELVNEFPVDSIRNSDGIKTVSKEYTFIAFTEGDLNLSGFPVLYIAGNKIDTIPAEIKQILHINTIVLADDFKPGDIRDIKSYKSDTWILVLLILGSILLICAALWLILGGEKIKKLINQSKITIPPYDLAITRLSKLKEKNLAGQGRVKEYYTELTDILKQFIESSSKKSMMDKTSEEVLSSLQDTEFDSQENIDLLKYIFNFADLAKFAKYVPTMDQNEKCWYYTRNIVESGKPEATTEELKNNEL